MAFSWHENVIKCIHPIQYLRERESEQWRDEGELTRSNYSVRQQLTSVTSPWPTRRPSQELPP